VNAVWTWLDTSPLAGWLFYGLLLAVVYYCRRKLDQRRGTAPRMARAVRPQASLPVASAPAACYPRCRRCGAILFADGTCVDCPRCHRCGALLTADGSCLTCLAYPPPDFDSMEDVPLPSFAAHLRRMNEAVREANQRAHGIPSGVVLRCEVDTLLRWAGIGSDDRRLW